MIRLMLSPCPIFSYNVYDNVSNFIDVCGNVSNNVVCFADLFSDAFDNVIINVSIDNNVIKLTPDFDYVGIMILSFNDVLTTL